MFYSSYFRIYWKLYIKKDGLPNRTHLKSNEDFEKQFIKPEPTNESGIKLITEILGYSSKQSFLKSVSHINTDNKVLVAGDSHLILDMKE